MIGGEGTTRRRFVSFDGAGPTIGNTGVRDRLIESTKPTGISHPQHLSSSRRGVSVASSTGNPISRPQSVSISKRGVSVATSTPFMSEKRSFSITDEQTSLWYTDEFVKEVQKWKLTVAVSAQVDTSPTAQRRLARRVPKVAENSGKRAFLDPIPESQQRASLDPTSPDWDFFMIPESQQPSYGRLESKTKLVLIVASLLCAVLVLEAVVQLPNVEVILGSWKERLLLLGIMTIVLCAVSALVVQELWHSPSSVSTAELAQEGLLPSTFSKINAIEVNETEKISVDVHYLHVEDRSMEKIRAKFDAIYCNHGFGANSLSWIPVLKQFGSKLGSPHVLCHDTIGFGLTSRPPVQSIKDLYMYGLSCSAGIGLALLERALSEAFPPPFSILGDKYVLLFGHSMGSLTTLRMALKLPESTKIKIILVAPAIVGFSPNDGRQTIIAFKEYRASVVNIVAPLVHSVLSFCMPAIRFIRLIFMDMPSYILLKRIIAIKAFWQNMLHYVVWGDPETLKEVDVERFRWPSIAKDCVWGVIHFLRAIPFQHGFMSYPGGDVQLLADVLALQNVHSVDIIQGTKDAMIPPSNGRRLAKLFPAIRIEELEGIGHAPFEEAPDLFMQTVRKMLLEN